MVRRKSKNALTHPKIIRPVFLRDTEVKKSRRVKIFKAATNFTKRRSKKFINLI